ncbi:unnamed protein product [Blepharisma stoltei]|uniref:EF-hand domain-containing protein n=1 Tax=Blepharisma stoltei TaxID=1481888 RepID=A0AAU9ICG3_9CILI|nr:unnamed protein product [Blepharisma stoltei]
MAEEIRKLLNDEKALAKVARPAFQELDTDRSGYIEEGELLQAMTKAAQSMRCKVPTKDQVKQIAKTIDKNQDGSISFNEFIELVKKMLRDLIGEPEEDKPEPNEPNNSNQLETENIENAISQLTKLLNNDQALAKVSRPSFNEIDTDNSGYIEEKELLRVMINASSSMRAKPPTKEDVKNIMRQIDRNSDGSISFPEYQEMLKIMLRKKIEELEKMKQEQLEIQRKQEQGRLIYELRELVNDTESLARMARQPFQEIDSDNSGYIEEKELLKIMTKASFNMKCKPPTKEQVKAIMREIDRNQDGKISFNEFLEMLRSLIRRVLDELEGRTQIIDQDQAEQQIRLFEKYLQDSGIAMAFQIIYTEILTKKIDPSNVFTYTAMRLRQIGKEVAHLLPKNLTAQLSNEN